MVTASGIEVLIEDKAAGGRFQDGQPQAYGPILRDRYRPVLIAPRSFLNAHQTERNLFHGYVALEDLAAALEAGAPTGAAAEREALPLQLAYGVCRARRTLEPSTFRAPSAGLGAPAAVSLVAARLAARCAREGMP